MTANRHVAEGKLRSVLSVDKAVKTRQHLAVYPARQAENALVRAFLSWLRSEAQLNANSGSIRHFFESLHAVSLI